MLSIGPSFDAYFLHDERTATDGRIFEQSGVQGMYVRYRLHRIKYWNIFLYENYVNKEEFLYLLTVAKLNH